MMQDVRVYVCMFAVKIFGGTASTCVCTRAHRAAAPRQRHAGVSCHRRHHTHPTARRVWRWHRHPGRHPTQEPPTKATDSPRSLESVFCQHGRGRGAKDFRPLPLVPLESAPVGVGCGLVGVFALYSV